MCFKVAECGYETFQNVKEVLKNDISKEYACESAE